MKKEIVEIILNEINRLFPDAMCELNHSNEFELLIAVVLSAQTTDASVNKLTTTLFNKYKNPQDYLSVSIEELENDLRVLGMFRTKAKSIRGLCEKLIVDFNGVVPNTLEQLQTLPGVGRKTANVVGSVVFGIPTIAVDTHVERIAKRLKFANEQDSVLVVEEKLMKAIDKSRWSKTHHQFIFFGRYFCKAKNPNCNECKLQQYCRYYKNN